jgi:Tfp pilus assembly protein PilV
MKQQSTGFGILEILIGSAAIALSLLGIMFVFKNAIDVTTRNTRTIQASYLLEEGVEAVKIMRDAGWANITDLTMGVDYFFDFTGTTWATSTTNVFTDGVFERTFVVLAVYRDANEDITESGAFDPDTKEIVVSVGWSDGAATTTKTLATYITNIN